jgi:ribonuclease Z
LAQAASGDDFKVTLLGTGTPPPLMARFGPATLVEVAGQRLLFDAGRGVTQRLWQKKIRLGAIDHLFLTHLHSDHVVGIPDLYLTGWLTSPFGRRPGAFKISGPAGTANMMHHLREAYTWDVETRLADQKLPEAAVAVEARDLQPGTVYEEGGVRVSAFEVDHGDLIKTVYGYRIDYDGRSVAISGDTRLSENLIAKAQGVDLLVHSIAAARPELLASAESWKRIMAHHIEPEDAGRVFARTKPTLAVFTHKAPPTNGKIPRVTEEELIERTRTTYDGPLTVGRDLMEITVAKDGVTVSPPD